MHVQRQSCGCGVICGFSCNRFALVHQHPKASVFLRHSYQQIPCVFEFIKIFLKEQVVLVIDKKNSENFLREGTIMVDAKIRFLEVVDTREYSYATFFASLYS